MKPNRIPLFPLDVVLFPDALLPLHIFEPRYKLMIRHCIEAKLQFGVILAREKGIAATGCMASITAVVKQYPDGKMDILTRGDVPFHVKHVFDEKPYYEASIEYLEELATAYPKASDELTDVYEQCYWMIFNRGPVASSASQPASPAYSMADSLPLPLEAKQTLLELRDERERQEQLLTQLKDCLPELVYLRERRQRSRGNGHSLN